MRRPADFVATQGGGRAGSGLVVAYASRRQDNQRLLGLAVSKAVGNSVIRHRVTRRLRAILASQLVQIPNGTGVVVRALPPAATAEYSTLRSSVSNCLGRAIEKASR
ncbi:MAG: ribonuclease P protein component [Micrococcales bacterium]|nr:ribonuclease P protein component [Micrococcales bacterium]